MFVLFISILNSPFHKMYMTLCPSTSQWKRVETITPSYSQNGLRLDVECYGREGESCLRSSSLLALRWWVNHFRLLEGKGIYRRKSLPRHLQRGPHVVRSLHESLWSLLPAEESPFVSQGHREERPICIFQKLLQPMSERRNEKESWKVFREDQNALALLTQRNQQKFLFPWSLPKYSPHREEEAAALWAPKGGQTPALRKSWPRGPLFDGSRDVFCFGKLWRSLGWAALTC